MFRPVGDSLLRLHVPQPDGPVVTARGETLAVGAPGHQPHAVRVSCQRAGFLLLRPALTARREVRDSLSGFDRDSSANWRALSNQRGRELDTEIFGVRS